VICEQMSLQRFAGLAVGVAIVALLLTGNPLLADDDDDALPLIALNASDWSRLWGSYRPSLYIGGMKTRTAVPVMTGAMWMGVDNDNGDTFGRVRHIADQHDGVGPYTWLQHDGRTYGQHRVVDKANGVLLLSSFVKRNETARGGGDWALRIEALPLNSERADPHHALSLFFYVGTEHPAGAVQFENRPRANDPLAAGAAAKLRVTTPETGEFSVRVRSLASTAPLARVDDEHRDDLPSFSDPSRPHWAAWRKGADDMWTVQGNVEQQIVERFRKVQREAQLLQQSLGGQMPLLPAFVPMIGNRAEPSSNIVALQFSHALPFAVEVAVVSHAAHADSDAARDAAFGALTGDALTQQLARKATEFRARLADGFPNLARSDERRRAFAEAAFSNLLGGMGYWFGSNTIYEGETGPVDPKTGKKQAAYSLGPALPLYSAVPSRPFFPRGFLWDEGFHQLIISHFDEQIALDAISHWYNRMHGDGWIPREQILGKEAASKVPPEFQAQHREHGNPPTLLMALEHIFRTAFDERKQAFLRSAWPRLERHYAWWARVQAGAVPASFRWRGRTVNHTLASGFDDYPRLNPPNDGELHLDGLCWMILMSRTLSKFATLLGEQARASFYAAEQAAFTKTLHERHWDEARQLYADAHVNGTFSPHVGYVSLFPVVLGILEPNSPRLAGILAALADPKQLWSSYGILSLSRSDPLFGDGENYWKGAIWININFLLVDALQRHYAAHNAAAAALGERLRGALVDNMLANFEKTGYVWEQYNANDGAGQRSRPFTGWSAAIVLLIR
jgi:mannosyl-oligosaccharide glucosidase